MDRHHSEIPRHVHPSKLFNLNFPLLKTIKALLNKWHTGLHSLFGQCNILRMSFLPNFLYLLQALPIHIPDSYFKQIQSVFIEFIWARKRHCLSRKILSVPKHGGLAMPDIRTCYHATTKLWPLLEQAQSSIPLQKAPWCY